MSYVGGGGDAVTCRVPGFLDAGDERTCVQAEDHSYSREAHLPSTQSRLGQATYREIQGYRGGYVRGRKRWARGR